MKKNNFNIDQFLSFELNNIAAIRGGNTGGEQEESEGLIDGTTTGGDTNSGVTVPGNGYGRDRGKGKGKGCGSSGKNGAAAFGAGDFE